MNPMLKMERVRMGPPLKAQFGWIAPGLVFLVLLLAYSPALLTLYGFTDDYPLLREGVQGGLGVQSHVLACGRPIYAGLLYLAFHTAGSIDHLVYLRWVGVLGIGLLAWRLFAALVASGWSHSQAVCLSLIITTMPAFQVFAAWSTAAFLPWGCVLAAAAWQLAERGYTSSEPGQRWAFAGAAVLALLAAITVHQSAAMFFWVFVAIAAFPPLAAWRYSARKLFWNGVIGCVALLLGFAVLKLGIAVTGRVPNPDRAGVTLDLVEKARWFLREPLVNALGFASLFPRRRFSLMTAVLIAGGLACYFRGSFSDRLRLILLAALLVPLSYAPNLIVSENWASYRTIAGLVGVLAVYAFFALHGYLRKARLEGGGPVPTLALGSVALACVVLAGWHVQFYFARPQASELERLRLQLRGSDLAKASGVALIRPRDPGFYGKRYDEFGLPSTFHEWVPESMVYLVLTEINPMWNRLPVKQFAPDVPMQVPPFFVVVDMNSKPTRAAASVRPAAHLGRRSSLQP